MILKLRFVLIQPVPVPSSMSSFSPQCNHEPAQNCLISLFTIPKFVSHKRVADCLLPTLDSVPSTRNTQFDISYLCSTGRCHSFLFILSLIPQSFHHSIALFRFYIFHSVDEFLSLPSTLSSLFSSSHFLHVSKNLSFFMYGTNFSSSQSPLFHFFLQTHPVDLDASKLVFTEAQRVSFNKYVSSTRIRAARNISGFSLPAGTYTRIYFLSSYWKGYSFCLPPRAEHLFHLHVLSATLVKSAPLLSSCHC